MVSPFSLVYQPCDNKLNFGDLRSKAFQNQETLKEQGPNHLQRSGGRRSLEHAEGGRAGAISFALLCQALSRGTAGVCSVLLSPFSLVSVPFRLP